MTALLQVGIALGAIASLLGVMAAVRSAARHRGWHAEVQRKVVHVATGVFAMSLPWLFADDWPVYLLLALTLAVMVVLRLPSVRQGGLGETLHMVERKSWGDFMLAAAVGLLFLFSDGSAILYLLPLAVVTLADAAAALAGSMYGRRFFEVEAGSKSIEGSAVFFLVCTLVAMICLLVLTDVPRGNMILLAFMVAGFATLVEADSWRGYDNLFLPVGLFLYLYEALRAEPLDLIVQAALFTAALVVFRGIAPALGLSRDAARVYILSVSRVLSVTAVQNALLPIILLGAHIWARIARPSDERFPDLDIIAALAVVSFVYLAAGEAMSANALSFYAMTVAAMTAGLMSLVLGGKGTLVSLVGRVGLTAALVLLWRAVVRANPEAVQWHEDLLPAAIAGLAAMTIATALRPTFFASDRALKLSVGATLPVLALYLWQTIGGSA